MDYWDCKCKKKLIDPLIKKCIENDDQTKAVNITVGNENENNYECASWLVYIVLMIISFIISTGITVYLVYYNWYLIKNNIFCIKFNTRKNTEIWWV